MLGLALAALMQTTGIWIPDTAAFVNDSIVIRALGVSIAVPGGWIGHPEVGDRQMCDTFERGPMDERILVNEAARRRVKHDPREWATYAVAAIDTVLPKQGLVADLRATLGGFCMAPQIRVYVNGKPLAFDTARIRNAARTIEQSFNPVEVVTSHSGEWQRTQLSWIAKGGDFSPQNSIELWSFMIHGRIVTIAIISAPFTEPWKSFAQRVIASVRY